MYIWERVETEKLQIPLQEMLVFEAQCFHVNSTTMFFLFLESTTEENTREFTLARSRLLVVFVGRSLTAMEAVRNTKKFISGQKKTPPWNAIIAAKCLMT